MGKKKKGAVCNNPVAMARAAGPPPVTGPTIRDYLGRDRPSLDEAAGIIASQHRRKESGALAAYEDQLNETYKQELKERREKLLAGGSTHRSRSKERKKKKKSKKSKKHKYRERSRSRSRSRSPLSTPSPHPSDTEHHKDRQHRSRARHKKHHRHKVADQPFSRPSSSDEQTSKAELT